MKKKIAIVSSYYFPDNKATSNRIKSFAELIDNNFDVELVVFGKQPISDFPSLQYEVEYCPEVEFQKKNLILRAFGEIKETLCLFIKVTKFKPDIVISSIPSPILLFMPLVFTRAMHVVDIRDVVWEYLKDLGISGRLGYFLIKLLAKFAFNKSSYILVTNSHEKKSIDKLTKTQIITVGNGISTEKYRSLIKSVSFTSTKSHQRLTLIYAGNIGYAQKLGILVDLASSLKFINIRIVGRGNDRDRLINLSEKKALSNIAFIDQLNWDELLREYHKADIIFGQIGREFHCAIPSKIFESVLLGKQLIFAAPVGAASNVLSKFKNVHLIEPENLKQLISVISDIADSEEVPIHNARYNRALIEKEFIRENLVLPLYNILKNYCNTHRACK